MTPMIEEIQEMVISASQLELHERCARAWWFRYVVRLPDAPSRAQEFGTAFHAALETWLGGEDPFGVAGWDQGLAPVESDLVRRLIQDAVQVKPRALGKREEAVVRRVPGQLVESEFWIPVLDGRPVVKLMGYVDIATVDGIHDNKTTKSRKWVKTPEQLRENMQLLVYARAWLEDRRSDGIADPSQIKLRHNLFIKDEGAADFVEVFVTPTEVDAAWDRVKQRAEEMRKLRVAATPRDDGHAAELLEIVPPAEVDRKRVLTSRSGPCGMFGGCAFREVCGGIRSLAEHRNIIQTFLATGLAPAASSVSFFDFVDINSRGNSMSIFGNRFAAPVNGGTAAPAAPVPPVATAPPAPPPAPSLSPGKTHPQAPPWARIDCAACRVDGLNVGFSTVGDACYICRGRQQAESKVVPDWFDVVYSATAGEITWRVKADYSPFVQAAGVPPAGTIKAPWVRAPHAPASPGALPPPPLPAAAPPAPAPAPVPAPAPPPPAASTPPPSSTAAEKPKRIKFVLCVNCAPVGPGNDVIRLDQVHAKYAAILAQDAGKASYYDIPAIQRWDLMASIMGKVVEEEKFGNKYVIASTGTQDMRSFVEALKGLADDVIVASQQ